MYCIILYCVAIILLWPNNLLTVVSAIIYYNLVHVLEAVEINDVFIVMRTITMVVVMMMQLIEMD
jgi:hypothetical protein